MNQHRFSRGEAAQLEHRLVGGGEHLHDSGSGHEVDRGGMRNASRWSSKANSA